MEFTHLHVHSEYSLLDGAAKIGELTQKAAELGQTALAITDHGAMYGAVAFYKACKKNGIKPIIGMETYVAPRGLADKEGRLDKDNAHLLLLVKNETGYKNLSLLSTIAFTQGFYYRPRIDYATLEKYGDGLIVMSACLAGDIPQLLLNNREDEAKALAQRLKARFGEDFYIELMDHGISEEKLVQPRLIKLARELDIKLVATNDIHYVNKEDWEAQDALLCVQTGKLVEDKNRMSMTTHEFYLKTGDEMAELFRHCPEAIANTAEVVSKCAYDFEFGKLKLPSYDVPGGLTPDAYFRKLCFDGLQKRKPGDEEYAARLEYELGVIEHMGYVDYFLIVWDFINFAKTHGIMVGPGRGSAAGSIAAYCMGITDIDPIKYGLLFERFLNPERVSMPDIDIDFCYERRQEVIDYVVEKYGEDRVSQIITFGTMAARSAIRDIGRVLSVSYTETDKLAKMIPAGPASMSIGDALTHNPQFKLAYDNDPTAKRVIDLALKVEGLPRNAGTHAAGVVISARPVVEYVPLAKNNESVTTQFPMGTIEELGLLKMDFLGLRTLTVIRDAIAAIKHTEGVEISFENCDYSDKAVYSLISSGETDGIFQLESSGMRAFLKQLRPDRFEDIIAGISLYRPGPMDQIPKYISGKFDPAGVTYETPQLEPILNMTYGCMVYQEQVMQIVRDLAGYSLGRSDLVRRAMAKKKADVMAKEREGFISGCVERGIAEQAAGRIFAAMTDFASYAFNKSHAAAYAVVAYRTAWLKAHYPAEFMAALINSFIDSTDKIAEYVYYCRTHGIPVLPPDINSSLAKFSVEARDGQKGIRFGLGATKNAGVQACEEIVREREQNGPYKDFYDFALRTAGISSGINKRMVENFIKEGAFDCFGLNRPTLYTVFSGIMDSVADAARSNVSGQLSLFDFAEEPVTPQYIPMKDYLPEQKLMFEKEASGMYLSGHPLHGMNDILKNLASAHDLLEAGGADSAYRDGQTVTMGGIVISQRVRLTKANERMAYILLEDLTGQLECVAFPRTLNACQNYFEPDCKIAVTGRLQLRDEQPNCIIVEKVCNLSEIAPAPTSPLAQPAAPQSKKTGRLYLRGEQAQFDSIRALLLQNRGNTQVVLAFAGKKPVIAPPEYSCEPTPVLLSALEALLGEQNVVLK